MLKMTWLKSHAWSVTAEVQVQSWGIPKTLLLILYVHLIVLLFSAASQISFSILKITSSCISLLILEFVQEVMRNAVDWAGLGEAWNDRQRNGPL